ncbi:unnamed protein product [Malus baccata var. baccata]
MYGPSDRRFDLNLGEEAFMPSPDNIWRPSFISPTGPLTVRDSVMKNDMTAAARNLVTPKDNRLLSKQSDELAVKDSLALSVQCAGSVSNMAQRLFARTRQVESLAAKSSGVVPRNEAPNDQPPIPPPSVAPSTAEALPTTETSPE